MKFSFSGRHMEVGESLTDRAREASQSLANKYGTGFIEVNVVMKKDGYLFHSDISAKTNTGNSYHASNSADDPGASFDITLHKIELQMQKKKKIGRSCDSCKLHNVEMNQFDNSSEENFPMIIAEILEDLPLLSVSDAANRLNEKTKIFVFENISNDAINVVYTRSDGNIGWIDYKIKNKLAD